MKTLIINNGTKHLDSLVTLFPGSIVVDKENLSKDTRLSEYDLLVFSGGSNIPTVLRHEDEYKLEIEIIKNSNKPIIGICLGAEIIVKAFGGELAQLPLLHRGLVELEITNDRLELELGSHFVTVSEAHTIGIKKVPDEFLVYAKSDHGSEIIKHKSLPITAFQFHPEMLDNKKIIKWFLENKFQ